MGTYNFRHPSEPLSPEQRHIRRMVLKQAESEPASLYMGAWENVRENWTDEELAEHGLCRTTRCIAGWAQHFARGEVCDIGIEQDAITLLGLTAREYSSGYPLFFTDDDDALERLRALAKK